jgi:hypothetical protein
MSKLTTLAIGEEEHTSRGRGEEDTYTTEAYGEEDPIYTTLALGEEDGGTTSAADASPFGAF